MLTLRLDSAIPLGEQIVAGIRRSIAGGELSSGDGLPTVRQLAADLGIHMNTVARAYRSLEQAGLVATVRGRGTTVTAERARAKASSPDVRAALAERLRDTFADAKLADMDREATRALVEAELDRLWNNATTASEPSASKTERNEQ